MKFYAVMQKPEMIFKGNKFFGWCRARDSSVAEGVL